MLATLLASLALLAPAQPPTAPAPSAQGVSAAAPATTAKVPALAHPVVLGASMSSGFGATKSFAEVLAHAFGREEPLPAQASGYFFSNPLEVGEQEVEFALDEEATLVVAVDFLFWFGYGTINAAGQRIASEEQRLELLEVGLELLDQLECPLIVGDFPDMSAAVGRMLVEAQMPAEETLTKLSARVRAWAKERGNAYVVPLAALVTKLTSDEAVEVGRYALPAKSKQRLLQRDELHPTATGLAVLAHVVTLALHEAELDPSSQLVLDLPLVLESLALDADGVAPLSKAK